MFGPISVAQPLPPLTLGDSLVGRSVRAVAEYTDGHGTVEQAASSGTRKVVNVNDAPTGSVKIDGKIFEGETVSANTSAIQDDDGILRIEEGVFEIDAFTYQWQRSSDGTTWADIEGSVEQNYTLGSSDVSQYLRVQVAYRDLREQRKLWSAVQRRLSPM